MWTLNNNTQQQQQQTNKNDNKTIADLHCKQYWPCSESGEFCDVSICMPVRSMLLSLLYCCCLSRMRSLLQHFARWSTDVQRSGTSVNCQLVDNGSTDVRYVTLPWHRQPHRDWNTTLERQSRVCQSVPPDSVCMGQSCLVRRRQCS